MSWQEEMGSELTIDTPDSLLPRLYEGRLVSSLPAADRLRRRRDALQDIEFVPPRIEVRDSVARGFN